jgi:hypothetical protein
MPTKLLTPAKTVVKKLLRLPFYSQALLSSIFAYSTWFTFQMFTTDQVGNVLAGHEHIWADGAAHLTMVSYFGYRNILPTSSPFVINTPFSYPFLVNWMSGLLVRLGTTPFFAIQVITLVTVTSGLFMLYWLMYRLSKKHSLASLASFLYLTNGGVGGYYFIKKILTADYPWQNFLNPDQSYSYMPEQGIEFINVVHGMLFNQRAFSLGLLAGSSLLIIFLELFKTRKLSVWKKVAAVVIIWLLPIIHTHTFLAMFLLLGSWTIWNLWTQKTNIKSKRNTNFIKEIVSIIIPSAMGSSIIFAVFFSSSVTGNFMTWAPGWIVDGNISTWFVFWIKNWGLTLPMWIAATMLLINKKPKSQLTGFNLSCLIVFLLSNLLAWQPNVWDNTKIFAWSSVGSSLAIAWLLLEVKLSKKIWSKILVSIIILLLTFTGVVELYRVARIDLHQHQMYSQEEVKLAAWARNSTDLNSVWLTSDQHNHWLINLTGRQTVMAYRGWLWTYGYDYQQLESDIIKMFANPQTNTNLFTKYGINYVVVGPSEKAIFAANIKSLSQLETTRLVHETANYQIWEVENTQLK